LDIDPISARLHRLVATLGSKADAANVASTSTLDLTMQYGAQATVVAPAANELATDDPWGRLTAVFDDYLSGKPVNDPLWFGNSRVGLGYRDLFSGQVGTARIQSKNATRQDDIITIAKALEIYKNDDSNPNALVPSTGGVEQRLDQPNALD